MIPDEIRRELEQHAQDEAPNEACGLIVFEDGRAIRYERGRNAADCGASAGGFAATRGVG